MKRDRDSDYISVVGWMWTIFVTGLPVVGWIMILVWAFTGDNESRKNYCRAILAWILVVVFTFVGLFAVGALAGNRSLIEKRIHQWMKKV
jgi:hypothetical protein